MTGALWAMIAALIFGIFQAFNRRAGRGYDAYWGTFILLAVSSVILVIASLFTEDLTLLSTSPLRAFVYFGLAGFIHFFLGWTFLTLSQNRIGAARTGALIGTTPLFALIIGVFALNEVLDLASILGILFVVAGVYLVSNG